MGGGGDVAWVDARPREQLLAGPESGISTTGTPRNDTTMVSQRKGDLPHPAGVGSPAAGRLVRTVPPRCPGAPLRPGLRPDGLDGADHQVSKGADSGIEDEVAPATTRMAVGLPARPVVRASNIGRPDTAWQMPGWWCATSSRGVAGLLLLAGRPQRPGEITQVRRLRLTASLSPGPGELGQPMGGGDVACVDAGPREQLLAGPGVWHLNDRDTTQ